MKGYLGESRTANAPQDSVVLTDSLYVEIPSGESGADPFLLASLRVAAGGKKLYDVLAAAGRAYLVDHAHVDGARLSARGFGATKPASPNTTPEGRQNNRRVELVRQ